LKHGGGGDVVIVTILDAREVNPEELVAVIATLYVVEYNKLLIIMGDELCAAVV
jgi:hypothetical protein